MKDSIVYNQVIIAANDGVQCHSVMRSYVEEGCLNLVLGDGVVISLAGRAVDTVGHKDRIRAILGAARNAGIAVRAKTVNHYVPSLDTDAAEYVLIKW